jgi:hypothetical protein
MILSVGLIFLERVSALPAADVPTVSKGSILSKKLAAPAAGFRLNDVASRQRKDTMAVAAGFVRFVMCPAYGAEGGLSGRLRRFTWPALAKFFACRFFSHDVGLTRPRSSFGRCNDKPERLDRMAFKAGARCRMGQADERRPARRVDGKSAAWTASS